MPASVSLSGYRGNSCYPGWGVKYPVRSRRFPAGAPATGFRSPRAHLPPGAPRPGSHAAWPPPAGLSAGRDLGSAASAPRPPCPGGDLSPQSGRAVTLLGGRGASGPPPPPARPGAASRAGAGFPSPAPSAPQAFWGPRKGAWFPPSAGGGRLASPLPPRPPAGSR